ncbi:MAG: ABC transporter permease subunit [Dokdonella sp.]|uniref:ABC transporter permease subunit n=1 Tax=Dokdonella sp. TaxID=2291710 RepID=UPI003265DA98
MRGALVSAGTALVLAGMLAIPLYLMAGLLPWSGLPADAWSRLAVIFAGTLRAGACAVLVAVPLGVATAMFTAHFCASRLRAWIKPSLEMLEAVPTVVFGLIATTTIAPWLATHVATVLALLVVVPALLLTGGMALGQRVQSYGWLPFWLLPLIVAVVATGAALGAQHDAIAIVPESPWNAVLVGLALGFASMPLVFSVAEDALFLVPRTHTQAAFALGATRWQALVSVLLPAAGSGLMAAALLGLSRCLGETMIVLMASGNTPIAGFDPLAGLRSISADLALGMPEAAAASEPYRSLLLAALLLLVLTLALNCLAEAVRERLRRRMHAVAGA